MENLDFRYSDLSDEKYLFEWLSKPDVMQWYPPSDEKELRLFVRNWIYFYRMKASLTAHVNGEVCGLGTLILLPYQKTRHRSMFYMIVDPKKTGQKIGTAILKNVLNLAENYFHFESVFAEVFEGAPINHLLKKDFEIIASQKKFAEIDGRYKSRILYNHCF